MNEELDTKRKPINREEAFDALEKINGLVYVHVVFAGGNDEGGPESIEKIDAEGKTMGLMESKYMYCGKAYDLDENGEKIFDNYEGRPQPRTRPLTEAEWEEHLLCDALEEPVFAEHDSFAVDYYVNGMVIWSVQERKVRLAETLTVESYEHENREI